MLWYCTKQHEEKLFRTWFYMKVTDGFLCCLIDDCWPWCYLTLLVITVEDTGWMYSAHLTRYWQRAILCKPHCVVLPVNLRLQSCCVWFICLLVTTGSKRLLSQTLHLKVSKRHEKSFILSSRKTINKENELHMDREANTFSGLFPAFPEKLLAGVKKNSKLLYFGPFVWILSNHVIKMWIIFF